ncbi:hypothetical protein [Chromohalobacter sp. 48-RD10]|uniref:hypothetical protein n=1 Tax=Chromohalobacter sp. 48-RD10 TaxID=2994063 RepID=UPI0024699E89|nr:hypothetical protein [Chromohalobacter sp. 48-RD10]
MEEITSGAVSIFHALIKDRLVARINNPYDAANYTLLNLGCTRLDELIEDELNNSAAYQQMRSLMPSKTPRVLSDFQNRFQSSQFGDVSDAINAVGKTTAVGQILFHGGYWPYAVGQTVVSARPLSTSFSPHMACQNAIWAGKAYDAGELHLMIMRVVNPSANAFCFRMRGTSKGHEKEVLFSAGARITLRNKILVKNYGKAYKACCAHAGNVLKKPIPYYILEIDVS